MKPPPYGVNDAVQRTAYAGGAGGGGLCQTRADAFRGNYSTPQSRSHHPYTFALSSPYQRPTNSGASSDFATKSEDAPELVGRW